MIGRKMNAQPIPELPNNHQEVLDKNVWERRFAHDEDLRWQGRPIAGRVPDQRDTRKAAVGKTSIKIIGGIVWAILLIFGSPIITFFGTLIAMSVLSVAYFGVNTMQQIRSIVIPTGRYYALSNKRAYIAHKTFGHIQVVEYELPLSGITHDGLEPGTISFSGDAPLVRIGKAMGHDCRFLRVPNAAQVCALMRHIAKNRRIE